MLHVDGLIKGHAKPAREVHAMGWFNKKRDVVAGPHGETITFLPSGNIRIEHGSSRLDNTYRQRLAQRTHKQG